MSSYDDLYDDLYGDDAQPSTSAAAPAPAQASSSTTAPAQVSSLPNNPMHFNMNADYKPAPKPADMPDEGKMFIGGLNWDTTDESLKQYFEAFGVVTHCVIMRDQETRRSRGFAFLTFEDPASVAKVLARDHHLDGKLIDPKRAVPRGESAKTDKLFVRNIPSGCTQESFTAYFKDLGNVADATLMMDKESGRHRGFGFVNYEDPKAVEKILFGGPHMMDGQALEIKRAAARGDTGNRFNNNNQGGYNQGGGYRNNNSNYNNRNNNAPSDNTSNPTAPNPNSFDPAMMAQMFQMMMAANPMMMGGMGMGGMGMGGMGNFANMGGMGFPNTMGVPYPNMMGNMGGVGGAAGAGGDAAALDYGGGSTSPGGSGARSPPSGAGRGRGAGGRPPTGPASMRDGATDGSTGAGPMRPRNSGGSNYHPYSR